MTTEKRKEAVQIIFAGYEAMKNNINRLWEKGMITGQEQETMIDKELELMKEIILTIV